MKLPKILLSALIALSLISCAGLRYNAVSLLNATDIKNDALSLISKSNEQYSLHEDEAELLKAKVLNQYIDETKRKLNHATVAMYSELMNSNGSLYSLLDLWKQNGTLSASMITESKQQIDRLISSIIDLENHKQK